jgi:hypothetical protein
MAPARFLAVPLVTPLPKGTAALFAAGRDVELTARGRLAEGELVVLEVAGSGAALFPAGPATVPDTDTLLLLLDSAGVFARFASDSHGDDGPADEPLD